MQNPFQKKSGYSYNAKNPFNNFTQPRPEVKTPTPAYNSRVVNPYSSVKPTPAKTSTPDIQSVQNAKSLYSGGGFVNPFSVAVPTSAPKLPMSTQYNPFSSLENRININPTVANSTRAIPGAMETKADNLTRTVLQTPKELAKQAGSNVAGLWDLVARSGLQTVSAVSSFVSPAVVSVIKAAEEELKAAEKDFKAAEKELMPDSKGQLADISYDQIWKDAMEAGEKRMLDIGRPDEYFRSKITGTPYQENLLFMDEIKALAKSSNEKMANGDTDGSFKDAGKIGGYAFMRDMANPFFLFSVRGVSQGSFKMTPAEKTLYKMQLNPSKEGFLGNKIKVKPKQAVYKIDVKPKYDLSVDGGKVKVQKSPNVKMYISQKSNGVVDIKVTNSGGEIFNKDIIKASFDKAGVSGLPAVQQTFSAKPVIPSISPATPAAITRGVGSLITPTTPTGLQFSGQELLQPNQEMAAPAGPVLDFGSPSAVNQPAVEQQGVAGETINRVASSQPTTQLDKSGNEVYNEKTSLAKEVKNYETADEFIQSQDVDNNLVNVYNKIYGKEENSNQFTVPEELHRGQGLPGNERTGAIGDLPKDIERSLSGLSEFINKNPDGFTVNLNGEPVSSGFAVSPYKKREVVLDQVDKTSLRSFLLNNFDLLREEGNNFGGWLNNENGKFYLDISKVVDNIDDAIGYAVYNDQISIFDLGNQSEIVTKDFLESRLKDIWNRENNEAVAKRAEEESQLFTGKQPNKVLENEAKKYKSADEFIEAQGEPVYHGGTANIKDIDLNKSNFQKTFYVSENPEYAKSFGGNKSSLNKMVLDSNAKMADLRNPNNELIKQIKDIISPKETGKILKIKKPDGTFINIPEKTGGKVNIVFNTEKIIQGIKDGKAYIAELPEVKQALKELGYDGMITQESKMGANYGIWNKDIIKTKFQLTDIWNKANSEPSTQKESVKKSIEEGPKTVKTSKKPTPSVQADKGVYAEDAGETLASKANNRKTSDFIKSDRNITFEKTVEDFIVSDRAKKILSDLGISSAEKYQGAKNLGVYKSIPNKARFKSLYDVITVSHEGAHGIDIQNGIIDRVIKDKSPVLKDLRKVYLEYYPGANSSKRVIIQLREGYASFIEHYFTNPNEMMEKFPELVSEFINPNGEYYNKQITQLLDGMNSLVEDFQKMTPEQRIGAKLRSGDEVASKDTGFTRTQRLIFQTLNYLEPFVRYSKETKTDIFSFANPQVPHYNWLNRNAIAGSWISNNDHALLIIDSKGNGNLIKRTTGTVKDYLYLIKGKEKEFDQYLVARRVVEDNNKLVTVQNKLGVVEQAIKDINALVDGKELTPKQASKIKALTEYQNKLIEQRDQIKDIIETDDFNVHDARSVVAQYQEQFELPTKIYDDIWKGLVEFSYRNNLITEKQFITWTNEKGYSSFKRFVNDDLSAMQFGTKPSAAVSVGSFKQRAGSGKDILSPVNSQIKSIFEIIPKSLENTVWVKTAELTNKSGNQELARRFEQVQAPDPRQALNNRELIPVKVDGKLKFYKPAPEFNDIRKVMSTHEESVVAQLLLIPTRIFTRATTSANPYFLLRNISMDQFSRAYNTEYGTKLTDVGKSFVRFVINSSNENIRNYKMLGGYEQTFAGSHDLRQLSHNQLVKKITKEGKTKVQKSVNFIEATIEVLETPSRISEMATREAEYERALQAGRTETEARFAAANVSVNFGQRGAWFDSTGRFITRAIPFFNPSLQGTYIFGQKAKAHPGRAAMYTAGIAALTLASTIRIMSGDDDDIRRKLMNISTTELAQNIFIPLPKIIRDKTGVDFMKLRMPEVVGSAVGLAQIFVISHYSGNEATFKEYLNVATSWIPSQLNITEPDKMAISLLPQAIKPSIETIGNFRSYPDIMPILSDSMKNKPLDQQYNNNTSALAKSVAPSLGISPILFDYWIKAQFGAAGKYSTQGFGIPNTFVESDKYLTVGRVYQKFFDQKSEINKQRQSIEASKISSRQEKYEARRDDLLYKQIGDTVTAISSITKDKLELSDSIKLSFNDLLVNVTNDKIDTIEAYNQLAKINDTLLQFQIKNTPDIDTFEKLDLSRDVLSRQRSMMVSSYEEAYRQFNPSAKPTNSLDKATQNLLNGLKKKIKEAGGSDADIEKVRDNIKLELSVDKEYKDRRKALENLPDAVKKQNPDLFQQARDEKNALRP